MGCRFDPWVGKIPWRKAWQPTPVFLPGESHGQRSLVGYSPQGLKQWISTHTHAHTHTHTHTHTHWASLILSWLKICLQWRRPRFDSWVRKILLRKDRLPSILGLPLWLSKNLPATWETWVWSLGWKDPLERISLYFHTLVKHFHLKFSDQIDGLKWPNGWAENIKHTLHLKT